ncbi:MAG: SsrA-binding protein, partial [Fervidobacterium sp.]
IAIAKGKKSYDKREDIKKKETQKKIKEYLKYNR